MRGRKRERQWEQGRKGREWEWSAEGLAGVTRCDSEHIGSQGGCYFTLQSHSPPVPQDVLIWSPRPKETRAQHNTAQRKAGEPRRRVLFQAFSFHLCGWVFNFITKMAAPFLITFDFICWVCVDAVWMNGSSRSGLCVNCVYMCACACKCTALLLIGLVRERETSTLSASPPPPLVTACIIDPEQLHFLSVSEFIRWSAFTQPDRIPPSSSFP